jgi:DNA-binding MarR family transcriptional regulator
MNTFEELIAYLLQQKPALTLAHLAARGTSYTSLIAKDAETTFAHCNKILNTLQKHGLVKILKKPEGDKRIKHATLTPEGRYAAEQIIELLIFAEHFTEKTENPARASQHVSRRINGIIQQLFRLEEENKTTPVYVAPLRWNLAKLKQTQHGTIKKLIEEIDERINSHIQHSRIETQEDFTGEK